MQRKKGKVPGSTLQWVFVVTHQMHGETSIVGVVTREEDTKRAEADYIRHTLGVKPSDLDGAFPDDMPDDDFIDAYFGAGDGDEQWEVSRCRIDDPGMLGRKEE